MRIGGGLALTCLLIATACPRFRPSSQAGDLAVHATDHAIAVEGRREHRWSWIYVSTGQDRPRTPSIGRTATDGTLTKLLPPP